MTNEVHTKQQLDALTQAFFDAVSFEEGERPPYDTLHALFIESGLLIKNSGPSPDIATVAEFIAPRQHLVDSGELTCFRESEIAEHTEIFGNVAHRLCTYAKSGVSGGTAFEGRGVISIQFIRTEAGWKVSSMAWDDERPGLTIPEHYR
jgi:hypothetical protein